MLRQSLWRASYLYPLQVSCQMEAVCRHAVSATLTSIMCYSTAKKPSPNFLVILKQTFPFAEHTMTGLKLVENP